MKFIASAAASTVPGSIPVLARGGSPRWLTGSATPQNMRIDPMPAAKSIANHAPLECSGGSSSGPSFARP
ncbi:Uncharacterised protein [Mycobacteroides abscessus subsp. abscessus]|nr:Uncharacterised protein [Mycobacteroides abscessus subsp. abscessus]